MSERVPQPPARVGLRERLRAGLAELGPPLRLIAEALCGEEEELIDWVAAEPDGRAVVGLLEPGEAGATLLTDGLTQRAWVAARLGDWLKLAPGLGLRPELRPRLLLVAADFGRRLRVAAREADAGGIWLVRFRDGAQGGVGLERLAASDPPAAAAPPGDAPGSAGFRTGLTDADLGLAATESLGFS